MRVLPLILAALAGVSMAVQGTLNAALGKRVGSFEASFIVHVLGSFILAGVLISGISGGDIRKALGAPWWSFLGGPLSVVIICSVLVSIGKVGVGVATTAIVASQITAALALDAIGATGQRFQMGWSKYVGAALFITGAYLLLKDRP